ncbi:glycosyltransferase family 9 protein [uncultured Sphingomonas sp.]|uniref:glycosyltransferase family 9 protein n=1 Tax=uncultured Sphingomonas sp. TaxID=158754 RepID=UPI0025DEB25B|nr:glycosyltransferase family 9 protein [uncultured Sphingomonas sp.]
MDWLPLHTGAAVARRLARQAVAAREAGQFRQAADLYGEALRFAPGHARMRVQYGHMLKEAGQFADAERQYRLAERRLPDDPDLALQMGHFYKIAGRTEDAAAAYQRALTLHPGWSEARQELDRLGGDEAQPARHPLAGDIPAPELLPRVAAAPMPSPADGVQMFHLGTRHVLGFRGAKVLRGVQAVRGACISHRAVEAVQLLLEGEEIAREVVQPAPLRDAAPGQGKYVFNIWHDFSHAPRGRKRLELRFLDASGGKVTSRRETVLIADAITEADYPSSDAVVDPAPGDLVAAINARPSMVRPATRSVLNGPVRSILVQRFDQLGDLVVSMPALRRLREIAGDAKLVGLLGRGNADLGATLGLFDEIITIDVPEDPVERRRVMSAADQQELRARLHAYHFDVAIDLMDLQVSRAMLKLSGARYLYAANEHDAPWLSASVSTYARDPANDRENSPVSGRLLALVERLGPLLANPARVVRREGLERALLAPYGLEGTEPYVVLHTGARLAYSHWPHFATLTALLLERTDATVVVLADDAAGLGLPPAVAGSPRVRTIEGLMPFDRFDALVSFCSLFIGNDSGPKHLAALRGARVLSMHMARLNWNEWGQEGEGLIVSRRVPCAGCGIVESGDCGREFACIRNVRAEEVLDAALGLLNLRLQDRAGAAG